MSRSERFCSCWTTRSFQTIVYCRICEVCEWCERTNVFESCESANIGEMLYAVVPAICFLIDLTLNGLQILALVAAVVTSLLSELSTLKGSEISASQFLRRIAMIQNARWIVASFANGFSECLLVFVGLQPTPPKIAPRQPQPVHTWGGRAPHGAFDTSPLFSVFKWNKQST